MTINVVRNETVKTTIKATTKTTTKTRIKRHLFLLLGSVAVLVVLLLVGYVLGHSTFVYQLVEQTLNKNAIELLVWRCFIYLSLYFLWAPLMRYRIAKQDKAIDPKKIDRLLAYRHKIVIVALAYEILIVQNLMAWFF